MASIGPADLIAADLRALTSRNAANVGELSTPRPALQRITQVTRGSTSRSARRARRRGENRGAISTELVTAAGETHEAH